MTSFSKYLKKAADDAIKAAGEKTNENGSNGSSLNEKKADEVMTETELSTELDRIDKKYSVSGDGTGGQVYERLEYDAPTDEEIKSAAESDLSSWKHDSLASIEDDAARRKQDAETARKDNERALYEAESEIGAEYDDAVRSFGSDMIKRGLARSSVAAAGSAELEESRAAAISDARGAAAEEEARIDEEIKALEADRERALQSFDIEYAVKLTEKIAERTEEREKRQQEVTEYNNKLTELERKELADSGSGGSSAKVPDSLVSAYNLEKYETVRKYLSGLDADEARVRVRNDPVVRDALTDYYYYKLYAEFGK
mgnify:FL=1